MSGRFFAVFTVLLAALALSAPVHAGNTWGSYHWARTANPFNLQVVDSVSGNWQQELNTTLAEWSSPVSTDIADVLDMSITSANDKASLRKRCSIVTGKLRVCNSSYGPTGWVGLATIGIDTSNHIVAGTAKVNDSYPQAWAIEGFKNHVMCQEVGHVLGLNHTSVDGSSQNTCMDYSTSLTSQSPNLHDYQVLASIYAHEDGYNSYDTGQSDGGTDDGGKSCKAPRGVGCNKAAAEEVPPMGVVVQRGKGYEIRVAPRAAGGLWIHHVTLVPEG